MNQRLTTETTEQLADLVECFDAPCIVDAPHLGQEMHRRGVPCAVFTNRDEFEHLPGFRRWELSKPVYLPDEFDFVLVVPEGDVRGPELYAALRVLCHFHYDTPIAVAVEPQRAARLASAIEPFDVTTETVADATLLVNFELP